MEKDKKKKKVPTAQKRDIQNKKRALRNKSFKSSIKTAIKTFKSSLKKDKNLSFENLKKVFSLLDKGSKKNLLHKNASSRIKSKLSKLIS